MRDRFSREISYLRISVTDRCNLRCRYCMPEEGVPLKHHDDLLSLEQIVDVVRAGVGLGVTKVRLTGGEPLLRRGIVDLVRQLRGIAGLDYLAMTTNGILLPKFAQELREAGLHGVNISLDTLDPHRYRDLTRGGDVTRAVAGVDAACAAGFSPIKINAVVSETRAKDDVDALAKFCAARGIVLQRIREYTLTADKRENIEYERPPRCTECNRLRLTADGKLKPCLHSNHEIPVNLDDPGESIKQAVAAKPAHGALCSNRSMMAIGG